MGMFKDLRDLKKMGKEQVKARGGRMQMMKDGVATMKAATEGAAEQQRLATNGVPGEATIKSMTRTGAEINLMPELQFELTVRAQGRTTKVTHKQLVSPAMLGGLQPGATVPCKVDPADHSKLMLGMAQP